jgi:drug/metabolite transporter (DMT)-like permease
MDRPHSRQENQHSMTSDSTTQPIPIGKRKTQTALYALLLGAMAISFVPIFVRLSPVGPIATAFWRLAISAPVFWLWMNSERRYGRSTHRPAGRLDYARLALAGLFFALDLSVWHWSIKFTTIANATMLANFAPIFVALFGWLIFGQKVSLRFVVGMLVALAGTVFLVGSSFGLSQQHILGDLLGVASAVFYSGYLLSIKRLRDDFSTPTIMLFVGLAALIVLFPVTLISGESFFSGSLSGWAALLLLALFSHAGGWSLITYAMAQLPAAFSSVTLLVQPVLATFLALVILGEPVGWMEIVGGALALLGIYLARRATQDL